MLGWEFPPHISGGLGTACYGMTKGLDQLGVEVCFILPTARPVDDADSPPAAEPPSPLPSALSPKARLRSVRVQAPPEISAHVEIHQVSAALAPYGSPSRLKLHHTPQAQTARVFNEPQIMREMASVSAAAAVPTGTFVKPPEEVYQGDLMSQIHRFEQTALRIARREKFDVVHAHDWMTFPAGLAVAAASGKPLVVHVHSTELDRAGQEANMQVFDIERSGMLGATRVVCVSNFTRDIAVSRYDVPGTKIDVVHNAVDLPDDSEWVFKPIRRHEKIVLFLGRLTMQKGPEYFLQAARKVVQKYKRVRFVIAGSGDMITRCIHLAAEMKLGGHVTFTGFLRGRDVDRIFRMADLYVMPSVSEPFGIAPLEAMARNVPAIISRQSGVSEVLRHALKVDFWDTDDLADKILAVLRHPPLQNTLRDQGKIEIQKFSWRDVARRLMDVYETALKRPGREHN